jgi:acyl carrier protein phosphodiesterase
VNYLAHALLAEPHAFSIAGNIAGDLVKGRVAEHDLHPRVADGLRRHRRVDALTDSHPRYRALRALFPATQRRLVPIVLDVLFDYFLTQHWTAFTDWPRDGFIDDVYRVLRSPGVPLPKELAAVAPRWVAADWLRVYESRDGVAAVIDRLARRASRPLPLAQVLEIAWHREDELRAGFFEVFHDVRSQLDGLVTPVDARRLKRHIGARPRGRRRVA